MAAILVPESAAVSHCAVIVAVTVGPQVIVTVVCGEHHVVVLTELIDADVTRVPVDTKEVVGLFRQHQEPTVLGVVPAEIASCLQVNSQLVAAGRCQLMK